MAEREVATHFPVLSRHLHIHVHWDSYLLFTIEGSNPNFLTANKERGLMAPFFIWRRERDSNPRYGVTVYTLSRRAPSATRTPLRKTTDSPRCLWWQGPFQKRRKVKPDGAGVQFWLCATPLNTAHIWNASDIRSSLI